MGCKGIAPVHNEREQIIHGINKSMERQEACYINDDKHT